MSNKFHNKSLSMIHKILYLIFSIEILWTEFTAENFRLNGTHVSLQTLKKFDANLDANFSPFTQHRISQL